MQQAAPSMYGNNQVMFPMGGGVMMNMVPQAQNIPNAMRGVPQAMGGKGGAAPGAIGGPSNNHGPHGGMQRPPRQPQLTTKAGDRKLCYFFNSPNGCKNGTGCVYLHEQGASPPKPSDIVCKYLPNCKFGAKCRFSHTA